MDKKIKFYFSFRSPYSWIAWTLLRNRIDQFELIPYWDPDDITIDELKSRGGDFLYSPMSKYKHRYIMQDVKRIAGDLSLSLKFPVDINPYWELPHLCFFYAKEKKMHVEYIDKVYKKRWEEGQNICTVDTICEVFKDLNFPLEALNNNSLVDKYRDYGVASLYSAYNNSVFGVPFFIQGKNRFWGIDRIKFISFSDTDDDIIDKTMDMGNNFADHSGGCG